MNSRTHKYVLYFIYFISVLSFIYITFGWTIFQSTGKFPSWLWGTNAADHSSHGRDCLWSVHVSTTHDHLCASYHNCLVTSRCCYFHVQKFQFIGVERIQRLLWEYGLLLVSIIAQHEYLPSIWQWQKFHVLQFLCSIKRVRSTSSWNWIRRQCARTSVVYCRIL